MFTTEDRDRLREELIAAARADKRITGAAVTGSFALAKEDAWSDIDLAFGTGEAEMDIAIADWTELMYRDHGAVHHLDVVAGASIYRVFLLENALQVDLAFSPESEYGAIGPKFRLLFGAAAKRLPDMPPSAEYLIGYAWLYARHAHSCIQRGRPWQAENMISGVRDHVLALACLRHSLPATQGRGMDDLPVAVTKPLLAALVRTLEPRELKRALTVAVEGLRLEVQEVDKSLAERLQAPLQEFTA